MSWHPQVNHKKLKQREHRYKFLRVSAADVLRALFMMNGAADARCLTVWRLAGLPEDVEVVAVKDSGFESFPPSFIFLLSHPSFPVVELHGQTPDIGWAEVEFVALERMEDMDGVKRYRLPPLPACLLSGADEPVVVEGGKEQSECLTTI